jgi:hypothetical protein
MLGPTKSTANARLYLILAAVITIAGWQFEAGRMILYPFTLLATYAHEMGHGLTALLFGGSFDKLILNPDGSGLAFWTGNIGRVGRGMISLGGLVGPSIAGATLLVLSRKVGRARILLYAISAFMLLTLLLFARSMFAVVFIGLMAASIGVIAHFAHQLAPFFVQLVGVQLCLSIFRDVSYMFSEGGFIDGVLHKSDSAQIADALLLPYWFWGGIAAAFSVIVLALGLYVALRPTSPNPSVR